VIEAEYRAENAVNWSTLKYMLASPLHYRHAVDHPREDRTALLLGRLNHAAILEPHAIGSRYAVYEGDRRAGKAWEAFRDAAEAAGLDVVKASEMADALECADAVRRNPIAARLLTDARVEVPLVWDDPRTGLRCKARLDIMGDGYVCDLKGSPTTDAHTFRRASARLGYHLQLEHYAAGYRATTGRNPDLYILVHEVAAPWSVAVFRIPDETRAVARATLDDLLDRLAVCRATGVWPDRYDVPQDLTLPDYLLGDAEPTFDAE
jgi:hypothetical protein